jgi:methionyl-tRNA formyltransferase
MTHANPQTVVLAGSTQHTMHCGEALRIDARFHITAVITPEPKASGRKRIVTPNPLDIWATQHQIRVIHVHEKIDAMLRTALSAQCERPALLLVVDFGYYIPQWLLQWPTVAPLNIHPSRLPEWRGSSPGQFVLLSGTERSAVSLMIVAPALDAGPIITQLEFAIDPHWTAREYYAAAFHLIAHQLPELLMNFLAHPTAVIHQPLDSPTPVARRLSREDGFIRWSLFVSALPKFREHTTPVKKEEARSDTPVAQLQLLETLCVPLAPHDRALQLQRAIAGLSPWPGVWTIAPNGKRLKLLQATTDPEQHTLCVTAWQVEGKAPQSGKFYPEQYVH